MKLIYFNPEFLQKEAGNIRPDLPVSISQNESVLFMAMETESPIITKIETSDKKNIAVADIRLDNKKELIRQYNLEPDISDISLILDLYEKNDEIFTEKLLGDFAFVIWDQQKKKLFAARDHIGIRPLFYFDNENFTCLSSDLDLLLSVPGTSDQTDEVLAANWIFGNILPHPEKMLYKYIKKLIPAHTLTVNKDNLNIKPYFSWYEIEALNFQNDEEACTELRNLLLESVKCRISPTGKVGSHLSGGIDSSSVAVLLNRKLKEEERMVENFSWTPTPDDKKKKDESLRIEEICKSENISCHYTDITLEEWESSMQEDPRQHINSFPPETIILKKAQNLGVKQIFSGWGGDEGITFTGRSYFVELFRNKKFFTIIREIYLRKKVNGDKYLNTLYGSLLRFLPPLSWRNRPLYNTYTEFKEVINILSQFGLNSDYLKELVKNNKIEKPSYSESSTSHQTQIDLFLYGHISSRCESWAMKGLRHNINYVFPLLDKRILSFSLAIPSKYYFYNGWNRWLYRESMKNILPDEVRWGKVKTESERIDYHINLAKYSIEQAINKNNNEQFLFPEWINDNKAFFSDSWSNRNDKSVIYRVILEKFWQLSLIKNNTKS